MTNKAQLYNALSMSLSIAQNKVLVRGSEIFFCAPLVGSSVPSSKAQRAGTQKCWCVGGKRIENCCKATETRDQVQFVFSKVPAHALIHVGAAQARRKHESHTGSCLRNPLKQKKTFVMCVLTHISYTRNFFHLLALFGATPRKAP